MYMKKFFCRLTGHLHAVIWCEEEVDGGTLFKHCYICDETWYDVFSYSKELDPKWCPIAYFTPLPKEIPKRG